jgi:hypothetical protein
MVIGTERNMYFQTIYYSRHVTTATVTQSTRASVLGNTQDTMLCLALQNTVCIVYLGFGTVLFYK